MITFLWISAFLLVLVGGFATFLVLEALSLFNKEDDLHTLSTYIKRARRRTGVYGSIFLTLAIWSPPVWLWGHLVKEWW